MPNKHVKRYSTLVIREMQMKTSDTTSHPRMAVIKKVDKNSVGKKSREIKRTHTW